MIAVIGNSGVGKTTFVRKLCEATGYITALEQHLERPYQVRFSQNHMRFALANQVDYLLVRAGQEIEIRRSTRVGIVDGGLDLDFHVFTKLFWKRKYLNDEEFDLCERLYVTLRGLLPPPDIFIWLDCPIDIITQRFHSRQRELEITKETDLASIDNLLQNWIASINNSSIYKLDVSDNDLDYKVQVLETLKVLQIQLALL